MYLASDKKRRESKLIRMMERGRTSSSSSSSSRSRRRKKASSNSDKPRQPQRGMGVAQLEKIRLQNQFSHTLMKEDPRAHMAHNHLPTTSISPSPSIQFGHHFRSPVEYGYVENADIRHDRTQSYSTVRTMPTYEFCNFQEQSSSMTTLPLLRQPEEDWAYKKRQQDHRNNSYSTGTEELDLDLRLSL